MRDCCGGKKLVIEHFLESLLLPCCQIPTVYRWDGDPVTPDSSYMYHRTPT